MSDQHTYEGWRPERAGVIWGLGVGQLSVVVGAVALPILTYSVTGQLSSRVMVMMIAAMGVVVLTLWRPGGWALGGWCIAGTSYLIERVLRWNVFVSRVASGESVTVDDGPDLPGQLSRLAFHDGPAYGQGQVGLVHDPFMATWTVVARLVHPGIAMMTGAEVIGAARAYGDALAGLGGDDSLIRRVQFLISAMPDDGTEQAAWQRKHLNPRAPRASLIITAELARQAAQICVSNQILVAIQFDERGGRRAAARAGGGPGGWGRVIARQLAGISARLQEAGLSEVAWLDLPHVAAAIRTGFSPIDGSELRQADLGSREAGERLRVSIAEAGPEAALKRAGTYLHDGAITATFGVILPRRRVSVGVLGPLLVPSTRAERRVLSLTYEMLPIVSAEKEVSDEIFKQDMAIEAKRSKSFRVTKRDRKRLDRANKQEEELSQGHGMVRESILVAITTYDADSLDDASASAQIAARGRTMALRRLWLAQDQAFFACVLPLALGLNKLRGGR